MVKNHATVNQKERVNGDGGRNSTVTLEEFYARLAALRNALASFDQILDDIALEVNNRQGRAVGSDAIAHAIEIPSKSAAAPKGKRRGKLQKEQVMETSNTDIPSGSQSGHLTSGPTTVDAPVAAEPHKKRLLKCEAWNKLKKGKQYDVRDAHKSIKNATYIGSEAIGGLTLHCFQSGNSMYKFSETSLREFSIIVESESE